MYNYEQHAQSGPNTRNSGDFEIWDLAKIQGFLDVSESTAKRLVLEEGFPSPIVNKERNRRWLASAVIGYLSSRSNGDEQRRTPTKLKTQKRSFDYITTRRVG